MPETRYARIVLVLLLLLVVTNVGWTYAYFDLAVTVKYRTLMVEERGRALRQALRLMPTLALGQTEDDLIPRVRSALEDEGFEKEGALWVGMLGFEFEGGRLKRVTPVFPIDAQDGP